jgi:atypical dual specificity phosphatase
MIACYLVAQGSSADEAIAEVRRRRSGSVQTRAQELCIARYAKEFGRPASRIGGLFGGME